MFSAQVLDHLVGVGGAVWRASWQASVLAALVVAVQLLFGKRIAARWRHAMWLLVLVRLALPVVPSSPMSVFNLAPVKGPLQPSAPLAPIERGPIARTVNPLRATVPPLTASRTDSSSSAKPQAAIPIVTVSSQDLWTGWTQILAILWAMGACLLAVRIAWATWRLSRALRRLDPVDDPAIHEVLRSTAAELLVRRLPRLLAGEGLFSPALVGFIRPKLLLPRDLLTSFDPSELRLVFLHELAHLKRRDVAINWAATVLTVLHWPNPVAWLAAWRLRLERELACDEMVMSRTSDVDRRAYGHTIVKLLETFSRGPGTHRPLPVGGVGILEGKAQMKRRIIMIAQFARRSRTWTVVAACLILGLGLIALTDAVQAEEPAKPRVKPATQPEAPGGAASNGAASNGAASNGAASNGAASNGAASNGANRGIDQIDADLIEVANRLALLRWGEDGLDPALGNDHAEVVKRERTIELLNDRRLALETERKVAMTRPTKLQAGDLVAVSIMDLVGQGVETMKTARVEGDGTINLPYVGVVKAGGLSPVQLEKALAEALREGKVVQNAMVAVSMPERGESHQLAKRPASGFMSPATPIGAEGTGMDPGMMGDPPMMEDPGVMGMQPAMMMEDPAMMGMTAPAAAPVDAATKAILARKLPEAKFDGAPLDDVIDFLRDTTQSNIFVNWRALESIGIDRKAPVTLKLHDVAFKDVLSLMLRQQGQGLVYTAENGVITIDIPKQPVKEPKLVTKAYDVADLFNVAPGQAGGYGGGFPPMVELTNTIISAVAPESWRTQGGRGGISAYGSKLVVTAAEEVHEDVVGLLTMLREQPATQPASGVQKPVINGF